MLIIQRGRSIILIQIKDVPAGELGIMSVQSHRRTESPIRRHHVTRGGQEREREARGAVRRRPFAFSPEGLAGVTLEEGA